MIGERGGTTASLDEARELQEERKPMWSATIRASILETLRIHGTFHADDLLELGIPADCKNVIGAQINALVRQGRIEETGDRRATSDPAGHGRRSAVYRLRQVQKSGPARSEVDLGAAGGSPRGSRSGKGNPSPCQPAAATSGTDVEHPSGGGGTSLAATAPPSLFEMDVPVSSHYEQDAA